MFVKDLGIASMTKAPKWMPNNKNSCTLLLSASAAIHANKIAKRTISDGIKANITVPISLGAVVDTSVSVAFYRGVGTL